MSIVNREKILEEARAAQARDARDLEKLRISELTYHDRLVGWLVGPEYRENGTILGAVPFRKALRTSSFPLKEALALLREARDGTVLEDWKVYMRETGSDPDRILAAMDSVVIRLEEAEKAERKKA